MKVVAIVSRAKARLLRLVPLVTLVVVCGASPVGAQGDEPTGDKFGDMQELEILASPPVAGAGIVFDFQQTYWNTLGLVVRPPVEAIIHFPRGVLWNGALFPHCDPQLLRSRGPKVCPPGSKFATGEVVAAVGAQALTIRADLTDFVGPSAQGYASQLLYVVPEIGSPFLLTGVIRDETSGPYGLAEHVNLRDLPAGSPLTPTPIVIVSIHNVDQHTSVSSVTRDRRRQVPLIVAPTTCAGSWHYAFETVFLGGPSLISTSQQPCVASGRN